MLKEFLFSNESLKIMPFTLMMPLSILYTTIGVSITGVITKEKTNATSGNISVQLDKLNNAGYIDIKKEFVDKKTRTTCSITNQGKVAFGEYVENLKSYLNLD